MAQKLKKCTKCGRMFSLGEEREDNEVSQSSICSRCLASDDNVFKVVREYVYDHAGCSIQEVSGATEVSETVILDYVRQGRLEIVGHGMGYKCNGCDKIIYSGKYCDKCHGRISSDLGEISKSLKAGNVRDIKSEYRVKQEKRY